MSGFHKQRVVMTSQSLFFCNGFVQLFRNDLYEKISKNGSLVHKKSWDMKLKFKFKLLHSKPSYLVLVQFTGTRADKRYLYRSVSISMCIVWCGFETWKEKFAKWYHPSTLYSEIINELFSCAAAREPRPRDVGTPRAAQALAVGEDALRPNPSMPLLPQVILPGLSTGETALTSSL